MPAHCSLSLEDGAGNDLTGRRAKEIFRKGGWADFDGAERMPSGKARWDSGPFGHPRSQSDSSKNQTHLSIAAGLGEGTDEAAHTEKLSPPFRYQLASSSWTSVRR